ncbi:hypothetical protein DdX_21063 [Ditylenchus destructor]|uniref:Uncharacterized protein n=1 Tax=Ditylenchus destructor TaxID=166010 RepID=A0AAD4MG95_9BILA|nr:hypothetical protein DdX_21063 [Ditylenchus destructor]
MACIAHTYEMFTVEVQSCTSFFCLTLKYNVSTYRHMLVMRLTLAFLVVVSSTVFLCQLRSMSKLNIKTRVVKMTIWFELIFDILPASVVAFNTVWEKVAGYQLSFIPYINKKTVVMGSLDTLCCGLFYSWILLRRFHTKTESGNTNGGNNGVVYVSGLASSHRYSN